MPFLDTEVIKRRFLTVEIPAIEGYNRDRAPEYAIRLKRSLGGFLLTYRLKPAHNIYECETRLHATYPVTPPETRVVTPLKPCPHLLTNQLLCLWRQGSSRENEPVGSGEVHGRVRGHGRVALAGLLRSLVRDRRLAAARGQIRFAFSSRHPSVSLILLSGMTPGREGGCMDGAIDLTIVLPAFNEAGSVVPTLAETLEALAETSIRAELLVVDDGSSDATAEETLSFAEMRPEVRLISHGRNRGYGAALRTGFSAARGKWVGFTDADGQLPPAEWAKLWKLRFRADAVLGHRVGRQDPWLRRVYSRGYNQIIRIVLGVRVRDCDCAMKIFRRESLPYLMPQCDGFLVNAEMLHRLRKAGGTTVEVGVGHRPRAKGVSKVSPLEIPRVAWQLAKYRWASWFGTADVVPPLERIPVKDVGSFVRPLARKSA